MKTGCAIRDRFVPESADGQVVLDRIVGLTASALQQATLLKQLETFTDVRVERYRQLVWIRNG
jgi:hypothetical protein